MTTSFSITRKGIEYEVTLSDEDKDLSLVRWHILLVRDVPYVAKRVYAGKVDGKYKYKSILLHRVVLERALRRDLDRKEQVDHWDCDPLNNTRKNLRVATHSQNQANQPLGKNNKSGFKGVHWDKREQGYVAQISVNGKNSYLGIFDTPEQGYMAYLTAAKKHFGEFANGG